MQQQMYTLGRDKRKPRLEVLNCDYNAVPRGELGKFYNI